MSNTTDDSYAEEERQNSLTFNKNILHIGTHNVKGFNNISKQLSFFTQYEIDYELDIIGLTETKTKRSEEKIWSQKTKKNIKKRKK